MRRAAKVDANQSEIVKALRQIGASVQLLHAVGQGCPDLLVGFRGVNVLIEVKDGKKPPSQRQRTPAQEEWIRTWRGQHCLVTSVSEALGVFGIVQFRGQIS